MGIALADGRVMHGHQVLAALEVFVIEDGPAHDGEGSVAPDEVVGENVHKIEKLGGGVCVDVHGDVLFVDGDAVFLVIGIGGVLQKPLFAAQRQLDRAQVPAGRVGRRTFEALVLLAERAGGVFVALGRAEEFGDILVVLFGFG